MLSVRAAFQVALAVAFERLAGLGDQPGGQLALRAAGRPGNNSGRFIGVRQVPGMQRAAARFAAAARPSNSNPSARPHRQIFRLHRQDGADIRQIENAKQSCFALAGFRARFRRDDPRPRPGRKPETPPAGVTRS